MNEKINLQDLVNLFCEKQGLNKKEAELFVKTMFDLIEEALATEKYVKIKGFGTFKLTEVNSRESVDVNTGERIEIQGHTKVTFTPDATMKDLINKPFSHFETVILNEGVELEDTPTEEEFDEQEVSDIQTVVEEIPVAVEAEVQVVEEVQEQPEVEVPIVEEAVAEEAVAEEPIAEEAASEALVEEPVVEEPVVTEEVIAEAVVQEEPPVVEAEKVEETPIVEPQPEIIELQTIEEEKTVTIERKKEKNINHILWGVIVVLVLIILFGAYWMFLRPSEDAEAPIVIPVAEEVVEPTAVVEEKAQVVEDTLETVSFIQLSEEELRKERVPSLADTLECQIVGTQAEYTLKNGETIIRASIKFFGTKKYWPYIVKHNMDILKDPDNIPAGVQLKIPKLVVNKQ
jgi:nucleoid DNA-binding protein